MKKTKRQTVFGFKYFSVVATSRGEASCAKPDNPQMVVLSKKDLAADAVTNSGNDESIQMAQEALARDALNCGSNRTILDFFKESFTAALSLKDKKAFSGR